MTRKAIEISKDKAKHKSNTKVAFSKNDSSYEESVSFPISSFPRYVILATQAGVHFISEDSLCTSTFLNAFYA